MSTWKEIKAKDIELDGDEINICIGGDKFGNNYAVVKVADIVGLLTLKFGEKVSGWISVKDRLPEENECDCSLECLVVCRTFGGYEGSYVSIEKAIFFKDIPADECLGYYNHYWQITSGDMIIPFEVTHWQPLPEIPK